MKENLTVYHTPICSKSIGTLALLKGKDIEIIDYMKNPPSVKELQIICDKLGIKPVQLLRTKEKDYKDLEHEYGKPSNKQALVWMNKYPRLMERPIVINNKNNKAAIGRPPKNVLEIL